MKKSQFRKLIRETIAEVIAQKSGLITEKFESKTAAMMFKKLERSDQNFFQGMARSYDIDWRNAPESAWGKGANPKLVNFFFVNKQNPSGSYQETTQVTPHNAVSKTDPCHDHSYRRA